VAVPRVYGIVPAAGRSRRMGRAKQLLDVAGRPMLLVVLEPLAAAHVAGVALITHRAIAEQINPACLPGVFVVSNEDEDSAMIDSVRLGLRAWLERETLADHDGFLVCPADHPGIATADFDACIAAFRQAPEQIVIGSHAGRRGHPLIFPASLRSFVESAACDEGLNALPRAFPDRVTTVECRSPAVARDIDTPQDYSEIG
jgi:molybdenum cofactor cytidylyltransferase